MIALHTASLALVEALAVDQRIAIFADLANIGVQWFALKASVRAGLTDSAHQGEAVFAVGASQCVCALLATV